MDCELSKYEKEKYKDHISQKYNIIKDNRYLVEEAIIPIANALKIDYNEVIDIFVKKYDEAGLYELHAYGEQARMGCLGRKVEIDLGLCWICDFFGLITEKDSDLIKKVVVENVIMHKKPYNESLEKGRKMILELLKK